MFIFGCELRIVGAKRNWISRLGSVIAAEKVRAWCGQPQIEEG